MAEFLMSLNYASSSGWSYFDKGNVVKETKATIVGKFSCDVIKVVIL